MAADGQADGQSKPGNILALVVWWLCVGCNDHYVLSRCSNGADVEDLQ